MKVLIHDFAGHPFPVQLSRALAAGGDEVDHAYSTGVASGRGDLVIHPDDPPSLRLSEISAERFERYSPTRRLLDELRYGRRLAAHVRATRPEVVLSGNTPLVTQALLWHAARRAGAARVYWVQDFLGTGTRAVLAARARLLGASLGRALEALETHMLRRSDATVVIAEDFADELRRRSVRRPMAVVRNWAPLDEIRPAPKDNPWSRAHDVAARPVAVYAGTLGLKHDPEHLATLARALRGTGCRLIVASEGRGRESLEATRAADGTEDVLQLIDYVAYEDLPQLLGSADVCLVLLEPEAGRFSVPSKILAYLAAGRAVVAALPAENLAATILAEAGAGERVDPGDHEGFAAAVVRLLTDPDEARDRGRAGRSYAECTFDIDRISGEIRAVLVQAGAAARPRTDAGSAERNHS